jgi:hypothetical protein
MNYNFLKSSQIKLFAYVLGSLVIVILIFSVFNSRKFHVVSTNPSTSSVSYITPFFIINYNKSIAASVSISSSPNLVRNYTVSGETIIINLNSMRVGVSYFIDIKSVTDINRGVIKNKIFKFTAQNISYDNLPKDQQQIIVNNQDRYPSPINNPITAHLPYTTAGYSLSSDIVSGPNGMAELVLNATITLSQVDMTDETAAIAGYKQDIVNYIESLGLNPANYTINYTIAQ